MKNNRPANEISSVQKVDISAIPHQQLSDYYLADEAELVTTLIHAAKLNESQRESITTRATQLVDSIRADTSRPLLDQFLLEYGLSSGEGVILMRVAEALLRIPDAKTRNALIRDRIGAGLWKSHRSKSDSSLVNISTEGLLFAKKWISASGGVRAQSLLARLGDTVLGAAVGQAMVIMGKHYVLGRNIDEAISESVDHNTQGFSFSFDMLGEAAITQRDADRYFAAYDNALEKLIQSGANYGGLSVKLSALYPRYEFSQKDLCVPFLIEKIKQLALKAKSAGLGLAIDAEEVDRLEVSLLVISALLRDRELAGWDGLSIVVQAYQRRATVVLQWLVEQAQANNRKIAVRLVKGAYWDSEIKRAQEMGLDGYPVFTRKENTDVSYIACARFLFENVDDVYPQFATHNAHTAATVIEMAPDGADFEFQCLHGMGETLHRKLIDNFGVKSRMYAPVGEHTDLLPYLVRRLLENGANSSFVNQLFDEDISVESMVQDPHSQVQAHASIANNLLPEPRFYLEGARSAAKGLDLTQSAQLHAVATWFEQTDKSPIEDEPYSSSQELVTIVNPADDADVVGRIRFTLPDEVDDSVRRVAASDWATMDAASRGIILRKAADLFEQETPKLIPLLVREAGKSLLDADSEIREAVDFCRYYADRCQDQQNRDLLPLGTVACISPWNFPMAIFLGQVVASLAVGNSVVAKPAEQTPLIAAQCLKILRSAGLPESAFELVFGAGEVGQALVSNGGISGVCFTGSTQVAKHIESTLRSDAGRALTPLIAETGGLNAMIVDSTALLEQAVNDVIASAFQSAGQRCSACRIVCVQEDVADSFIEMLSGAMACLSIGNPESYTIDVGPLIDDEAASHIRAAVDESKQVHTLIFESELSDTLKSNKFVPPTAVEIESIALLKQEIFGPLLHVYRFNNDQLETVVSDINALGYGLTFGLHTRIDDRVAELANSVEAGNIYVNRNQIGAVVGVQPFGGQRMSGTGPKAGGPHYLRGLGKTKKTAVRIVGGSDSSVDTILPNNDEASVASLGNKLELGRKAQKSWANSERKAMLQAWLELMSHSSKTFTEAARSAFEAIEGSMGFEKALPGPTGETNTLSLSARGLLVSESQCNELELAHVVVNSLAAGNALILQQRSPLVDDMCEALAKSGLPSDLIQVADRCMELYQAADGVVIGSAVSHELLTQLCDYEQGIMPIISYNDDFFRFSLEKCVSVDTTAAGGNATLLASL